MRDTDWKLLWTLYQNKNITRTAELFFLSQPTLSKRIQQMEEELGTQLIIRNTKGITFTPKGDLAVKYAVQIIQLMDELQAQLADASPMEPTTIRIGLSGSIANYIIPGFFTEFSQKYPHFHADIADYMSDYTIDLVSQNKLDFGFVCTEVFSSLISKYLIRREPCFLVSKVPLSLEKLPEIPRIFINQNEYSNLVMQNWWNERYAVPPEFGFKARNGEIAVQMIKRDLCYGLVFYRGKHYFEDLGLHAAPIYFMDGTPVYRNCWLIYNRKREHESLIQNFMNEIRAWDFSSL